MKKVIKIFDHIEEYILMALMAVMASVVFIQVVFRFLGKSLPWSEEFTRYSAVWITFIGASLGVKRGAHVGVEALKMLLPGNLKRILEMFGIVCMIFLEAVVIVYSVLIIQMQIRTGQLSPAMRIPMWWTYMGIPIGMGLGIIRSIQTAFKIMTGKPDTENAAGKEGNN